MLGNSAPAASSSRPPPAPPAAKTVDGGSAVLPQGQTRHDVAVTTVPLMSAAIRETFAACGTQNRPAFVAFVTAGFPSPDETPDILLALEEGGADVIELGIPFTDPLADGPTIQGASEVALRHNVDIPTCLEIVSRTRSRGLKAPIVLMGYYNPILNYGEGKLVEDCVEAGVHGFIVVDLPPEEAVDFRDLCASRGLSYVPLIAPSTSDKRIAHLAKVADSFIYVVSKFGVTGASDVVDAELPVLLARIRAQTAAPLAVGFGVGRRSHFELIGERADGVVIGSQIITVIKNAEPGKGADAVRQFASEVSGKSAPRKAQLPKHIEVQETIRVSPPQTTLSGRFGQFGGQYLPEALVEAHAELEKVFTEAVADPNFWEEFRSYYPFMGRPSQLQFADRLTQHAGGAKIWLKREDLNHTGSHKINNTIGQILLAKRLGKRRIIAETGAGQHGVATATVCAKFGFDCVIYMGAEDARRQALNVFRMRMLGATVVPVKGGSQTLKDAINEAMRDWVTNVRTTHYLVGSAIGPHPFPTLVREFQSVIGRESLAQFREATGKHLPDAVVACVGGGSNSIGLFREYVPLPSVRILGVEAGGDGTDTDRHSATLSKGRPGVLHGTRTYLLQDGNGQIKETHSISAGLDYPGVGPEHAWLKESGRAEYIAVTDAEALDGFRMLTQLEGIIPALESAHAIYGALKLAALMTPEEDIIVCLSGRGDKDMHTVAETLPTFGPKIDWDLRF